MKVIRNIHNNVCICLDSQNREVVVFGKGVGFIKPPHNLSLNQIERTFYDVDSISLKAIEEIPADVIQIAIEIVDTACLLLHTDYPQASVFPLADHLNFAIKRKKENIYLGLSIEEDIKLTHPKELEMGYKALDLIQQNLGIKLPRYEATYIAFHLINYSNVSDAVNKDNSREIIDQCFQMIEEFYCKKIDRNSFNSSRFITHVDYLLQRIRNNTPIESVNMKMFDSLKEKYPTAYQCALSISKNIFSKYDTKLSDEEIVYLMIHINRLYSHTDQDK